MVKSCWICKTAGNKLKKSYYRIPKIVIHRNCHITQLSALREEKWRRVLVLPDETSGIRICSDHFLSGAPARLLDVNDPDWIPTQKLKVLIKNAISKPKSLGKRTKISKHLIGKNQSDKLREKQQVVLCGLCVQMIKKEFCINIFQAEKKEKFTELISTILGHDMTENEKLFHHVCQQCLKKAYTCNKLLTFFRNNEKRLIESSDSIKSVSSRDSVTGENNLILSSSHLEEESEKFVNKFENALKNFDRKEYIDSTKNLVYKTALHSSMNSENGKKKYDKEQIRSIIEDNSVSSDEEFFQEIDSVKLTKRKYEIHYNNIKPVEIKTLKCSNCFKRFSDVEDLKIHKNFCKLFYCQLCKPQVTFTDKGEQISHKKKYHSQPLVCHICGNSYSQSYLLKHFKNHFEDKKKCPFCHKTLKNVTILMAHIDNFHSDRFSNVCERCGGHFKNLKKHLTSCKDFVRDS